MSKSKKTRHQKIIADLRRKLGNTQAKPQQSQESNISKPIVRNVASLTDFPQVISNNYSPTTTFIIKDLRKISLLTLSIIIFQIILFTLLKNHTIQIPGITY